MTLSMKDKKDIARLVVEELRKGGLQEWVSDAAFKETTGLTTNQLRTLRRNHPEVWKAKINDRTDSKGRTIRRGFLYNQTMYRNLFTSPLQKVCP